MQLTINVRSNMSGVRALFLKAMVPFLVTMHFKDKTEAEEVYVVSVNLPDETVHIKAMDGSFEKDVRIMDITSITFF